LTTITIPVIDIGKYKNLPLVANSEKGIRFYAPKGDENVAYFKSLGCFVDKTPNGTRVSASGKYIENLTFKIRNKRVKLVTMTKEMAENSLGLLRTKGSIPSQL
jgi:hypothetical protein